jgi:hypothetical protein
MLACGIDPCAPRPNRRICKLSAAEVIAPARPATVPEGAHHDVLAENHIRLREALEQPVVDHGLRSLRRLLAGLKDCHYGPAPRRFGLGEQFGGADEPGYVHVVAAHMTDGDRHSVLILGGDLAGIGKSGRFLDGQRVHVGAQHDGRPLAVPEQADHAGLSDTR